MKKFLNETVRDLELPLLAFPVLVTVFVAIGFLLNQPCSVAEWWLAAALTGLLVIARCREIRRISCTLVLFAGVLGVVWALTNVSCTHGWYDTLVYHQPAIRMMIEGWNPVWQGTPEGIERATGLAPDSIRLWHVLSMSRGVWYFCAAAAQFTQAHFNLLFPLVPFLVIALAYAFLDSFKGCGLRARALLFGLSFLAIYPEEAASCTTLVDYVVALGAIGLLVTMADALQTGRWHWQQMIVFTFWMAVSKHMALLQCALLWGVFLIALVVLRRRGWLKVVIVIGLASFTLFASVGVSPYVTIWKNYGHPLYPQYTVDEARCPSQNLTEDFLARNADATSMGHATAWVNAYVSPTAVKIFKEWRTGRNDFVPETATWTQHEHSPGAPTTLSFRVAFCAAVALLFLCCGACGHFLVVCLFAGTVLLPTPMIGYLRYTPWALSIGAIGIFPMIQNRNRLVFRILLVAHLVLLALALPYPLLRILCLGACIVLLVELIPVRSLRDRALRLVTLVTTVGFVYKGLSLFAGEIDTMFAIQEALASDTPKQLWCLDYDGRRPQMEKMFSGNLQLLQKNVPALASSEIVDEANRLTVSQSFWRFYDNSFSVSRDYDLSRFSESWRDPEGAKPSAFDKIKRIFNVYFVVLPRCLDHAIAGRDRPSNDQ